ncbi:MAG: OsmC family protein [Eubacteriales bacterium]|nr:OsmC family protein [Eubacteriales bacterium]
MQVKVDFSREFKGSFENERGASLKLGREAGEFEPYELLPAALAACFYATFLGIVEKQKLDFEAAEIELSGKKREEAPTFLESVLLVLKIKGAEKSLEPKFSRAAELAAKYCSIYQTIAQVAKMELKLELI